MSKKLKGYDVYFTLRSPASVLIAAYNKREAIEIAEDILVNMSREELIDRLLAAVDFDGLKIKYVDHVDTWEEE